MPSVTYTGHSPNVYLTVDQVGSTTGGAYIVGKFGTVSAGGFNAMGYRMYANGALMDSRALIPKFVKNNRAYAYSNFSGSSGGIPSSLWGSYVATGSQFTTGWHFVPINRGNAKQGTLSILCSCPQATGTNAGKGPSLWITLTTSRVGNPTVNKPNALLNGDNTTLSITASYINPDAYYSGTLYVEVFNGTVKEGTPLAKAYTNSTTHTLTITDAMAGKTLRVYSKAVGKDGSTYTSAINSVIVPDTKLNCWVKDEAGDMKLIDKGWYQAEKGVWKQVTGIFANTGKWSRL